MDRQLHGNMMEYQRLYNEQLSLDQSKAQMIPGRMDPIERRRDIPEQRRLDKSGTISKRRRIAHKVPAMVEHCELDNNTKIRQRRRKRNDDSSSN